MFVVDWFSVVGFGIIFLCLIGIIIVDGFTIADVRRERDEWRRRYAEQCSVRLDEAEQDAAREAERTARFEVQYADLQAKCKAAGIAAEGWRKTVEKEIWK